MNFHLVISTVGCITVHFTKLPSPSQGEAALEELSGNPIPFVTLSPPAIQLQADLLRRILNLEMAAIAINSHSFAPPPLPPRPSLELRLPSASFSLPPPTTNGKGTVLQRWRADMQSCPFPRAAKEGSTVLSECDGSVERPWNTTDARLVLEDGSVWRAKSFGASGTQVGEVVFNTSLTGYQEILTDPSYAGQFVLMTNPHIGNTGVNLDDCESRQCFLAGLVIRSLSICTSNWRCRESLADYLEKQNIMGIYDVDTRAITRRLREHGSLIGVLTTDESQTYEELIEIARKWEIVGLDLISSVSCEAPYKWSEKTDTQWEFHTESDHGEEFHVVAYDFGIKHNILRRLASYGCQITVVPSNWPASETLEMKPDGVLFSNGPGDPAAVPYAVETVKNIIGKVPVFGICMGHQLVGQALGGMTFKMKFGHHGGNHPVCNLRNGCVEISAQNHNYAVDPASLPTGVEVTHINLNDNSCAGLSCPELKLMSLQYHPEASPGPHDSDLAFREFIQLMKSAEA